MCSDCQFGWYFSIFLAILCCLAGWGEEAGLSIWLRTPCHAIFPLRGDIRCVSPGSTSAEPTDPWALVCRGCRAMLSLHTMPLRCCEVPSFWEVGTSVLYLYLTIRSTYLKSHLCFCIDPDRTARVHCVQSGEKVLILLYLNRILNRKTNLMLVFCFFFFLLFQLLCLGFWFHHIVFDPWELDF